MKLFKFLAIIAVVLTGASTAKAQMGDWTIGLKAGANYTNLYSDTKGLSDKKGKVGFTAGAFARMGQTVFFQPELNFVHFSSEFSYNGQQYDPTLSQLNVPLMVGYKLLDQDALALRVSIGPDFSYNLNEPDVFKGHDFKKFAVGGVFNVGVDLGNITLDARYSRSFTDLDKRLGQQAGIYSLAVGFKIL
ncbi:porin family protein [Olivibacter sp. CPCC 100613]|uniref:porin family protein n=1 Tax=Olivibacter sp. CPCC 100613 TaxID=3079931 RepID=UPI002FF88F4C